MSASDPTSQLRDYHLEFTKTFPFFNLIGLDVLDMQPGQSTTRLTYRPDLCQPAKIMHGGMIATLIDTGIAHALLLTDVVREITAQGGHLVSIDLRIRYFRPVSAGSITCVSKIPRLGRQIMHGESVVTDDAGKEVAKGESIYTTVMPANLKPRSDR